MGLAVVRGNGLRKARDEKQPGDLVLVETLLKILYGLDRGRFCLLFRELRLCPEGIEEPRVDDV